MRDICTESIIPVKPTGVDRLVKYLLIVLLVAAFALVVITGLPGMIAMGVLAFLLYRHLSKTNAEYEYVHTNDVFDVDLVTMNSRRKQLCSVDLSSVTLVARADSEAVADQGKLKRINYAGDATPNTLYAMVYGENGTQKILLLQLDERMRSSLKQWLPGKVK